MSKFSTDRVVKLRPCTIFCLNTTSYSLNSAAQPPCTSLQIYQKSCYSLFHASLFYFILFYFLKEFCNTLDSSPPTSPAPDKPEVKQEVKQEVTKDKSSTAPTPAGVNDISAIEDILQLLKALHSISTSSAYDFGDGKILAGRP